MRYHVDYMEDVNYTYKLDYDNCEELESGVLYDKNSSDYDIIYMAWAATYYQRRLILTGQPEKENQNTI